MIYRLQKKFILISTVSVMAVMTLVFAAIFILNVTSINRNLDILADTVSAGGGRFPSSFGDGHKPEMKPPAKNPQFGFITPETRFATRHFTVLFDSEGNVESTNTEAIFSITEETAVAYARKVLTDSDGRGWLGNYRYKVYTAEQGTGTVFIDGSVSRSSLLQSMTIAGTVLLGCAALVLLLIVLLSKRVVKPIAESYEKQKQFITDANHELKTPLTLILANLDIAEAELGQNEWLDDIRAEGNRMTELVQHLVSLSRMDEEEQPLRLTKLSLSDMLTDLTAEFAPLAESRGKTLRADIPPDIEYCGDEALLARLFSVLLDNAVKYCDASGDIWVTLRRGRRITVAVENTYAAVSDIELSRLFDRFYRADRARTFSGGYGIGLSMAKAIAQKHKGEIFAYEKDSTHIGFKVVL